MSVYGGRIFKIVALVYHILVWGANQLPHSQKINLKVFLVFCSRLDTRYKSYKYKSFALNMTLNVKGESI